MKAVKIFLGIFFLFASHSSFSRENVEKVITISDPTYRLLNLAIPQFTFSSNSSSLKSLGKKMRTKLNKLSDFTGIFRVVSENAYSGFETNKQNKTNSLSDFKGTDFTQWKTVGIEVLLKVRLKSEFLSTKAHIIAYDTLKAKKILEMEDVSIGKSSYAKVAREVMNKLQEFYTRLPGPFSEKIVFVGKKTKKSQNQVFICDVDGGNLKQVTDSRYLKLSPAWGPKSKIIFTSYRKRNPDLYIKGISSSKMKLLSGFKGINSGGIYDPYDDQIIYTGSSDKSVDLYALNQKTGKRRKLTFGKRNINVDPDISKDGKWLVYVSDSYGNPHIIKAKIHRFTLKGERLMNLGGHKRLTFSGWYNTMPNWSPDGKEIVYASFDKGDKRFDLFRIKEDGTGVIRLTSHSGNNEAPSWSPNGRTMVFHSNRDKPSKNIFQLYLMNKDGTKQDRLKLGLYSARNPKWGL